MPPAFDPFQPLRVAADIMGMTRSPGVGIAGEQTRRLSNLLCAARDGSPLYRDMLAGMPTEGATAQELLGGLPPVRRHTLMQHFDDWCTDRRLTKRTVAAFIADKGNIAEPLLGQYTVWESSGTQGEPGYFVQDARAMAVYDALEGLRRSSARWFDPFMLGERIAFVGATDGHFASFVTVERLRRLNPWFARNVQSFSLMQRTEQLIDALNAFAPTIITTYPTAAALLADQARAGTLRTRPRELWTGGETLTPAVREHVVASLGCVVRNHYGTSEFLATGWECSEGRLHANNDWVILEPVDAQFEPVAPGCRSATTLLTNLANHVQPLIRYDIGDSIAMVHEPCACGSSLPVIDVQGRQDDALAMADTDGRLVAVLPLALMTAIEDDAAVFDFQIHQRDAQTLVLRLPPDYPESAAAIRRCRQALRKLCAAQGLAPIRLVGQTGRTFDKGRSGKVRRIIARPASGSTTH